MQRRDKQVSYCGPMRRIAASPGSASFVSGWVGRLPMLNGASEILVRDGLEVARADEAEADLEAGESGDFAPHLRSRHVAGEEVQLAHGHAVREHLPAAGSFRRERPGGAPAYVAGSRAPE